MKPRFFFVILVACLRAESENTGVYTGKCGSKQATYVVFSAGVTTYDKLHGKFIDDGIKIYCYPALLRFFIGVWIIKFRSESAFNRRLFVVSIELL